MNNKKYLICIGVIIIILIAVFFLGKALLTSDDSKYNGEWKDGFGTTENFEANDDGTETHTIMSREKGNKGEIIEKTIIEIIKDEKVLDCETRVESKYDNGSIKEEYTKETINKDGSTTYISENIENTKDGLLKQVEELKNINKDNSYFYEKITYETDKKGNVTITTITESADKNGKKTKDKVVVVKDKDGNIVSQK